ncbi:nitrogen regulation protein NR(II) [Desulfitobacterium sp. PCE1]|uniref:two-component system sensor histidine kinase NtrB n=1 Tax=Desulfitobacterium sp. PCE1 TaxID=146907 RepID=UPI0003619271|nr:ATP-binding protein [Desulfitobacterium sp. PCE1]
MLCQKNLDHVDSGVIHVEDSRGLNWSKDAESIIMVTQDNTEQKFISETMKRMEELHIVGQLAASLGHEIRNPISVVKGFLQILRGKNELFRYTEYLDMMISEVDRVDSMMNEFLAFGRLGGGDPAHCNLNDIIRSILPLLRAYASELGKRILIELEEIPDLELNEKEIRQMVMNLVRNGLEAMAVGGELTIRTFYADKQVVLAVQDQGEGIPPYILEKLGTPFLTTKDNGTGLGLSVCLHIVAKHRGSIDVQTGENGTAFFVRFPCKS